MTKIQLTIDGVYIPATDGIMYIDGRYSLCNQIEQVKRRNERYAKNFPHKIANGFYFVGSCLKRISETINF
jgi:hypothetical protein